MATHRYWRLYVSKACSPAEVYVSLMELELRTSIGGSQAATGGTASASTTDFGWVASNAFNGSLTGSGWHSNNTDTPQWLKYDFGAGNEKDIVEIAICPQSGFTGRAPSSFLFQWSDDDSAWTTLFDVVDEDIYADGELRVFNASDSPTKNGNKTFWRINATASVGGIQSLMVSEIEMATSPGGTDQCTGGKAYRYPCGGEPQSSYQASNAFDDNVASVTSNTSTSDPWPMYIGYRFASLKDIAEVKIRAQSGSSNYAPTDFTIEYWDGSAYQVAATYSGLSWSAGETKTFTFGSGPTQRPVCFVAT